MKVRTIQDALPGEQLIGLSPTLRPIVDNHPRKRLNLYPGRQLTHSAMNGEQRGRAARLTIYGRMLSPGVVDGLEAALDLDSNITLSAGVGLTAGGEDVSLPFDLRIQPRSVPVFTPAVAQLPPEAPANPLLEDFIGTPAELPRAGILIVRPVTAEILRDNPFDPCETDPADAAFENQQLIDGARLMFYPWPEEWMPPPDPGAAWRNRLAYAIFGRETLLDPGDPRPWDHAGVAVGLIAFDDQWEPLFLDRYAVVRSATPRTHRPLRSLGLVGAGDKRLLQARLNQLAEHCGSLDHAATEFATEFVRLPPAGLLPRELLDLSPPDGAVFTAELAEQDGTSAGRARVTLAPVIDNAGNINDVTVRFEITYRFTDVGDRVDTEELFIQSIDRRLVVADAGQIVGGSLEPEGELRLERNLSQLPAGNLEAATNLLNTTGETGFELVFEVVNGRRSTISGAIQRAVWSVSPALAGFPNWIADAAPVPVEQLDAVVAETADQTPISATDRVRLLVPVPQAVYDPRLLLVDGPDPAFAMFIAEKVDLRDDFLLRRAEVRRKQNALHHAIHGEDIELPEDPGANPDEQPPPAGAAPAEPDFGTEPTDAGLAVTRLAAFFANSVANAPLRDSLKQLVNPGSETFAGLQVFIKNIQDHIRKADDHIDLSFTRVKADVYRVLQFVVGEAEATRLGTSPALAAIAKTTSAAVAGEQIRTFYQMSKEQEVPRDRPTRPAPSSPTSPAGGGTIALSAGLFNPGATFSIEAFPTPVRGAISGEPERISLLREAADGKFQSFGVKTPAPDMTAITGEAPVVGQTQVRTTTVASRLEAPKSTEARDYALATKFQVYNGLSTLDLNLDDVLVPGVSRRQETGPNQPNIFLAPQVPFRELEPNAVLAEPQEHLLDEGAYFANGAELLEHTVTALRAVEGRVNRYREVLAEAQKAMREIQVLEAKAGARLDEIADSLAEARHDVTVARALLDEEQRRVDAINRRRREIIEQHVRFLAYRRPRSVERPWSRPVHTLDPGITEFGAPRCLSADARLPDELHGVVNLFRDAPVKWFPAVRKLLERVDRLDVFQAWLGAARRRAIQTPVRALPIAAAPAGRPAFASAINGVFQARQSALQIYRAGAAQLDLGSLRLQSWRGARQVAEEVVSLGDVIDGAHGKQAASQQAARELERIESAAGCLYSAFSRVPPAIRLIWAGQLSQFDAPVNLRNLQVLPRWSSVDILDRRELQAVTDFLFQRVDPAQTEASELVSDLVRCVILIASHAPVGQIVEGRVAEPSDVRENGSVRLNVDISRVRIGMNVVLYAGQQTAAHAVVEDVSSGFAMTRIVQAIQPGVRLAADARAQFVGSGPLRLLS